MLSDFIVTSTLASQAPAAVGRALAAPLAATLNTDSPFPRDMLSYVSLGDGSVNNAHFLAALNLAEYAQHRGVKCPVLFGISDNGLCISLKGAFITIDITTSNMSILAGYPIPAGMLTLHTRFLRSNDGLICIISIAPPGYDWLPQFLEQRLGGTRLFPCDGTDPVAVYAATADAAEYVRKKSRPACLVFSGIPRRFGHAATDRQLAYLTRDEIAAAEESGQRPLERACALAVSAGVATHDQLAARFAELQSKVERAFDAASEEPKPDCRDAMIARNSAPLWVPSNEHNADGDTPELLVPAAGDGAAAAGGQRSWMRKHMTRVFAESLEHQADVLYIGEDVMHGGYYLVTDGLADRFPLRVRDFPPDETTLVGAGVGYAQAGFVPVVEIPYAKYLDCGADVFFEACVAHWLSNGARPNGMVVRLQGFDKGLFGGNFHTHNALHMPPGLDVVCYSNGEDYVRGMRNAIAQARRGRVVMSVDCTALLNQRHLDADAKDGAWLRPYPALDAAGDAAGGHDYAAEDVMGFDDVRVFEVAGDEGAITTRLHRCESGGAEAQHGDGAGKKLRKRKGDPDVVIISYGNGVPTSLNAARSLVTDGKHASGCARVTVLDVPLLSGVSGGLRELVLAGEYKARGIPLVFADLCKEGQAPLASTATALQSDGLLPGTWRLASAPRTYNPIGTTLTFLSERDVEAACLAVLK